MADATTMTISYKPVSEVDRLVQLLSRLPGLGPRSARRLVLHLVKRSESLPKPLAQALSDVATAVRTCSACGNIDSSDPCAICADNRRDPSAICVVEEVGDLWAIERTGTFRGRYHVLGGTLSALDGIGPDELRVGHLVRRASDDTVREVILATNATVDGQTTAHYLAERLAASGATVSRLAYGVPIGGELDYLYDGTLTAAMSSRRAV
jgi:recombination protein RecR